MPWSYKKQRQVDSNSLLRISCRRSRSKVPLLFSHACYLAHLSTNLYSKGGLCSAKKWSCEVVGGHQFSKKRFSFVLGKIWLLWLLIWHFVASGHIMASGMFFKFGTSHHVAADLLVLGATLVVHMGRFGHLFLGKSGANSTGLCLRENQQWFFDKYRPTDRSAAKRRGTKQGTSQVIGSPDWPVARESPKERRSQFHWRKANNKRETCLGCMSPAEK